MGKLTWFQYYRSYSLSLKRSSGKKNNNTIPLVVQVGRWMNKFIDVSRTITNTTFNFLRTGESLDRKHSKIPIRKQDCAYRYNQAYIKICLVLCPIYIFSTLYLWLSDPRQHGREYDGKRQALCCYDRRSLGLKSGNKLLVTWRHLQDQISPHYHETP